jgi:membrane-associated phospholipid phosphatase
VGRGRVRERLRHALLRQLAHLGPLVESQHEQTAQQSLHVDLRPHGALNLQQQLRGARQRVARTRGVRGKVGQTVAENLLKVRKASDERGARRLRQREREQVECGCDALSLGWVGRVGLPVEREKEHCDELERRGRRMRVGGARGLLARDNDGAESLEYGVGANEQRVLRVGALAHGREAVHGDDARCAAALASALKSDDAACAGVRARRPHAPPPQAMSAQCTNTNDDTFFNKCRMEYPPGARAALGMTTNPWINPTALTLYCVVVLLVLPLVTLLHARIPSGMTRFLTTSVANLKRFHLHTLNFFHRVLFSTTLNVCLYIIFRQRRPCECLTGHPLQYKQVGSIYGMPSGDAMSGGVLAAYLLYWRPGNGYYRFVSVGAALAVMALKINERLSLGMHSIGQVTTGTVLGLALSAYSERAPQFCIFIDLLAQILLGAITFPTDDELHYGKNDGNNIFAWYLWGLAGNVVVATLVLRFYALRRYRGLKQSLRSVLRDLGNEADGDDGLLESTSEAAGGAVSGVGDFSVGVSNMLETERAMRYSLVDSVSQQAPLYALDSGKLVEYADYNFTLVMIFAFFSLTYLAYLAEVYAWGYS